MSSKIPKKYKDVPEWKIWKGMKKRCYQKTENDKSYRLKGIIVCDRWLHSFDNFYVDMGPRPTTKHSIDRIDNDGNYEPSNCRWATATEQSRNQSKTKFLEFNGERRCVSEWAEILGVCESLIRHRITSGWTVEDALTKGKHGVRIKKSFKPSPTRPVLDTNTGILYPSMKIVSHVFKIPIGTLCNYLRGNIYNKTSLVYATDEKVIFSDYKEGVTKIETKQLSLPL